MDSVLIYISPDYRCHNIVEKMSCLTEMSPVGNRIRLENGEVVFKSGNAEISCRNK